MIVESLWEQNFVLNWWRNYNIAAYSFSSQFQIDLCPTYPIAKPFSLFIFLFFYSQIYLYPTYYYNILLLVKILSKSNKIQHKIFSFILNWFSNFFQKKVKYQISNISTFSCRKAIPPLIIIQAFCFFFVFLDVIIVFTLCLQINIYIKKENKKHTYKYNPKKIKGEPIFQLNIQNYFLFLSNLQSTTSSNFEYFTPKTCEYYGKVVWFN